MTKPLSIKEYPTRILSTQDMILYFVNKESEAMIPDRLRELRYDFRPHKAQWSETMKRAFATDVIKFMQP